MQPLLTAGRLATAAREQALMAATIWQFIHHPPAADRVPWPGGFALKRSTSWKLQGQQQELPWRWYGPGEFEFADQNCRVQAEDPPPAGQPWALEIDGSLRWFRVNAVASSLWIWQSGSGSVEIKPSDTTTAELQTGLSAHCHSPGPGVVLRILVTAGASVETGQALLVLESMKMETTLRANSAGRVDRIEVQPGDLVESDQRLLSIDSPRGDTA